MALLDLKTDLKSLKYGNDQPGGGNSGQPYQQVDINKVDTGFNRFRMTKFDDGLVRGGVVGAANASVVDTLRIGKFLKDFPKGPLFIVKQIGLQLSNPQLETKKLKTDNPTKGGGLLTNVGNFILNTANKIVNTVGPTRIYNLGINTLAQVPVGAFGQHFNRHGLLPVQDDQTKYLAVAQNNNNEENNKLAGLRNRFGLGFNYDLNKGNIKLRRKEQKTLGVIAATFEGGVEFANSVYDDIQNSRIADYVGGPNSVYGIGRTLIKRVPERTNDKLKIEAAKNKKYNAQHIPEVSEKVRTSYGTFREASLYSTSQFTSAVSFGNIPSPSGLEDKIANSNDIDTSNKDQKSQGKVANVKIKKAFDYKISTKTRSNLSSGSFNLQDGTAYDSSFLDYDVTDYNAFDLSKIKQQTSYANASSKVKDRQFLGLSTNSTSNLSDNKFENDGEAILRKDENQPKTLNDKIASNEDKLNDKAKLQISDANKKITSTGLGISKQYPGLETPTHLDTSTYSTTAKSDEQITTNGDRVLTVGGTVSVVPIRNASYQKYQQIIESKKLRENTYDFQGNQVNAFGIYGDPVTNGGRGNPSLGILPTSNEIPTYTNKIKIVTLNKSWKDITRENRVGSGVQDQINLTPIFEATTGTIKDQIFIPGVGEKNINDLVKFRIQALNFNNPSLGKWMIFRAYITQFSDSVDATWNEIKYAGRGDKFYVYDGFGRKVSISFKVAALSAEEMKPMYSKLNYLMGNLMGSYENNLLHGSLVKMTIGNWFDGQDAIINSLSYTIPPDSPWEIAVNNVEGVEPLILPHVVEVSMTFTPIGSQTKGANKLSEKFTETSNIAQNINDTQYTVNLTDIPKVS